MWIFVRWRLRSHCVVLSMSSTFANAVFDLEVWPAFAVATCNTIPDHQITCNETCTSMHPMLSLP
jgi:hypothetical protein